ncbi:MAG: glutamine-hydrolyzing GMP synthase [Dehalococcoidales bacterium]|nr:glutamine-hydrolyzing GMP synthase [Dehalococcoidales bacterium]
MDEVEKKPQPGPQTDHRVATTGDIEVSTYLEIAKEISGEPATAAGETVTVEREAIVVIDFGSQYSLLIARRIRECQVYCELVSYDTPWEKIASLKPKGFILSGGPASVYQPGAPLAPAYIYESHLPVLGICYGMQVITKQLGGQVAPGTKREYGHAILHFSDAASPLFAGLEDASPVWMSHADRIEEMPPGFKALAYTENSPVAVMGNEDGLFGIQFHPEVAHTPQGKAILRNFAYRICGCKGNWTIGNFINESLSGIRQQVEKGKVITALSGGVDSAVVATLIDRAVGDQLTCIYVNNGLLRREEVERTAKVFRDNLGMSIVYVDASQRFLDRLKGITDPEVKRKAIGEEFIEVFEEEANRIGRVDFLAQGTLYPDVIESAASGSTASAKIKTHHNVGGLPARMRLKLIEPLRYLFKDEVRKVGLALGMPEEMVWRQPFPGPGLAIRVIGEVTPEKLEILRSADFIVMNEIKRANLYRQLWQTFAVLTDVHSVGVMGDYRTYGYLIALRAVTSEDAMTADWARLPYDVLARISNSIVNEVPEVNRVVYDITSKPPSTIEWE